MSAGKRSLRTRAIIRAVQAPELERYLSRRSVDLLVTDQLEAVRVRVEKGIEVLERKAREGIRAGRRRAAALGATLAVGLLLAAAHLLLVVTGRLSGTGPVELLLTLIAGLALLAALVAGMQLATALRDVRLLARIPGRHRDRLAGADTADRLLAAAEEALEEARALGFL
jgi:hypothetical protein